MNINERFNPVQYLSIANEDDIPKVLEMAYHFENIDSDTLPETTDVEDTVDQQLVDLDNMYRSMHDVEERLKNIAHEGVITPESAEGIEKDYPGTIVNAPISIEGREGTSVDFKASLENMKRLQLGLIIGAIISTIALLLKWVTRKVTQMRNDKNQLKTAVDGLSNLLAKTNLDVVELFKEGMDRQSTTASATAIGVAETIKEILGDNVSLEQVTKIFGTGRVTYATLLANSDIRIQKQVKSEVLSTKDGIKLVEADTKFLASGKNDFYKFVEDCSHFSNDLPRWMTGLKEHGGVGRDGRPLTPEAPINTINLDVIVNMSKTLGIALNQPSQVGNVSNSHQFITLSKPSLNERVAKYRNGVGDETLSESMIAHLNNPEPLITQLTTQREHLNKWQGMVRANSNKLGSMSKRLSVLKNKLNEMPADADSKVVELEALSVMVVSNFSSICRYLVTIDDFNATTTAMFDRMVSGIRELNKILS